MFILKLMRIDWFVGNIANKISLFYIFATEGYGRQ